MNRYVSDLEFEHAWANPEYQAVIKKVIGYFNGLPTHVRAMCAMTGLWSALREHQAGYSTKFTTSVWNHVKWACLTEAKRIRRKKEKEEKIRRSLPVYAVQHKSNWTEDDTEHLKQRMHLLPEKYQDVLNMKYIQGLTIKEMSEITGFSVGKLHSTIKKGLSTLKEILMKGME